jgi:hypothetical protein
VLKLIAIVEEARGYRGRALFGHINRAINLLLRPTPGAWLSPLDILGSGPAIAKTTRSPSISRCGKRTFRLSACAW